MENTKDKKADPLASLQRYELDQESSSAGMVSHEEGDYVKYEDVAKLFKYWQDLIEDAYQRGWEDGMDED